MVALGVFAAAVSAADAATWYVDRAATGANNGTSWANAWTSLARISGVAPGDTVYISGGPVGTRKSYDIAGTWNPPNGVAGKPITYQIGQESAHRGTVVFNRTGGSTTLLGREDNVVISGDAGDGLMHFELSGGYNAVIAGDGTVNFRLAYMNMGTMGGFQILKFNPGRGIELDHNYCDINGTTMHAWLYIQCQDTGFDGTRIHHNTIRMVGNGYGVGPDAIATGGNGISIYNNRITGYTGNYTGGEHGDGWQALGGNYIKIYNNVFTDIQSYPFFASVYFASFSNIYIYNNICHFTDGAIPLRNPPQGGGIGAGSSYAGAYPIVISNAVIANNLAVDYLGHQTFWMYDSSPTKVKANYVNCIFANNLSINSGGWGGPDAAALNYGNVRLTKAQAASLFVNYREFGAANNDYRLQASATNLIKRGTNLFHKFTIDRDGLTRPATGAWDIGPHQFGGGAVLVPVISVTPSTLSFGAVPTNSTVTSSFTVQNTGSGTLSGTATVPGPYFKVVSGGAYNLGSNQSQTVAISYTPGTESGDTQTITFTGGGGATRTVSGSLLPKTAGLSFEPSAGAITSPFSIQNGMLSQPFETVATNGGRAVYRFTVPDAGTYVVQMMVNAPNSGADSIYYNIDAEPQDPEMIWDIPLTSGVETRIGAWRGKGTFDNSEFVPKKFKLTQGEHQLYIRGREGNTQIGRITLLKVPSAPKNVRIKSN